MATRPIAEGLFEGGPQPRLIGGRHRDSGKYVFPLPSGAEAADYDEAPLSPTGRLWSYTVQRFRPKSPPYAGPEAFEPYVVGYVELPGQVIVEGRLVGCALDDWRIGMALRTVILPFLTEEDGTTITIHGFEPAEDQA